MSLSIGRFVRRIHDAIFVAPLRVRYLANEVSELRQLVRHLVAENASYRTWLEQTRASFDYQWRNLQSGEHLLTDEAFRAQAVSLLERYTSRPASWFRGKQVLDAGCGNGRWSRTMASLGANVTAIDQSEGGVKAALEACREFPSFRSVRHDILTPLPFGAEFDLVWSYGVIHHTGDTRKALENIARCVRPGGGIFLMVYGEPRFDESEDFQEINEYVDMRRKLSTLPFPERVPYLRAAVGEQKLHGWFDAVSPPINDLHRFDELAVWLTGLGFVDVKETFPNRNLHVVARRPDA